MKLSEIAGLREFALLGPGFSNDGFVLVTALRPASRNPALVFLPYEGETSAAGQWSGVLRREALELDVSALPLHPALDSTGHGAAVARVREAIAAGDVYQVNVTVRARVGPVPGAALFATLCRRATPRFAAWVRLPDGTEFVSASPELFFSIEGRTIRCQPMKGTARTNEAGLLADSAKDVAELAMITDLVRNDLTSVCVPRSVRVDSDRRLLELPYAIQAVSDVSGTLADDTTLASVLKALHPAGSITGAPKQAACRMIRELETTPRGAYCGALGLVEGDRATFSLLIRTASRAADGWAYGVGGGIVWDSEAERELDEIRVKLGALG